MIVLIKKVIIVTLCFAQRPEETDDASHLASLVVEDGTDENFTWHLHLRHHVEA